MLAVEAGFVCLDGLVRHFPASGDVLIDGDEMKVYLDRDGTNLVWREYNGKEIGEVVYVIKYEEFYKTKSSALLFSSAIPDPPVVDEQVMKEVFHYVVWASKNKMPFGAMFEDIAPMLKKQWKESTGHDCPISDPVPREEGSSHEKRSSDKDAVASGNGVDVGKVCGYIDEIIERLVRIRDEICKSGEDRD